MLAYKRQPAEGAAPPHACGAEDDPELIAAVAREAAKSAKPLDNTDFVYGYRKRMAEVFVSRALEELA